MLLTGFDRLEAITKGLEGDPDPETKGSLLINKALMLRGVDPDTALGILGELALDPSSTLGTESFAKAALAGVI
jgi:hypothetical protein